MVLLWLTMIRNHHTILKRGSKCQSTGSLSPYLGKQLIDNSNPCDPYLKLGIVRVSLRPEGRAYNALMFLEHYLDN